MRARALAGLGGVRVQRRGRGPAPERGARGCAAAAREAAAGDARRLPRRGAVRGARSGAKASFVTSPAETRSHSAGRQLAVRRGPSGAHELAEEARAAARAAPGAPRARSPCGGGARAGRRAEERRLVAVEQRHAAALGADPDELAASRTARRARRRGSPRRGAAARRAPTRRARAAATAAARARRAAGRASRGRRGRCRASRARSARARRASTGSTSRRSAATDARRMRRSTSGSHQSMPVPPGRRPPRTSRPAASRRRELALARPARRARSAPPRRPS